MPQESFEFHDSEVSWTEMRNGHFIVRFSAACVHPAGSKSTMDATLVYAQSVELVCHAATIDILDDGCIGRISEGALSIQGQRLRRPALPGDIQGDVILELCFANQSVCRIRCVGVSISSVGEPRHIESYRC